jgi:hypothetical protein
VTYPTDNGRRHTVIELVEPSEVYQEEIPLFGTEDKLVRTFAEDDGPWVEVLVAAHSGQRLVWDWSGHFRDGNEALAWLSSIE